MLLLICLPLMSCDFTSPEQNFANAHIYAEKQDFKKAIEELNKAIDKKKKYRRALFNRAIYKTKIDDIDGAVEDYYHILSFTNCTECIYELAIISYNQEKYEEAIELLNSALKTKGIARKDDFLIPNIELVSDDSDSDYNVYEEQIYFARGLSYLKNEQFVNAIKNFEKTNELNFYKNEGYYYIAEAYIGLKDSVNACQNFIESAKLGDLGAREMLKEHCLKNKG